MVNFDMASQVWSTLELYFASRVRAKASQYKTQLNNTKKGSLSMNEYLLKIRSLVDMLSLVSHELSAKGHVEAICDGLPEEHETFILTIDIKNDDYTVEEIEFILLAQEARIKKRHK